MRLTICSVLLLLLYYCCLVADAAEKKSPDGEERHEKMRGRFVAINKEGKPVELVGEARIVRRLKGPPKAARALAENHLDTKQKREPSKEGRNAVENGSDDESCEEVAQWKAECQEAEEPTSHERAKRAASLKADCSKKPVCAPIAPRPPVNTSPGCLFWPTQPTVFIPNCSGRKCDVRKDYNTYGARKSSPESCKDCITGSQRAYAEINPNDFNQIQTIKNLTIGKFSCAKTEDLCLEGLNGHFWQAFQADGSAPPVAVLLVPYCNTDRDCSVYAVVTAANSQSDAGLQLFGGSEQIMVADNVAETGEFKPFTQGKYIPVKGFSCNACQRQIEYCYEIDESMALSPAQIQQISGFQRRSALSRAATLAGRTSSKKPSNKRRPSRAKAEANTEKLQRPAVKRTQKKAAALLHTGVTRRPTHTKQERIRNVFNRKNARTKIQKGSKGAVPEAALILPSLATNALPSNSNSSSSSTELPTAATGAPDDESDSTVQLPASLLDLKSGGPVKSASQLVAALEEALASARKMSQNSTTTLEPITEGPTTSATPVALPIRAALPFDPALDCSLLANYEQCVKRGFIEPLNCKVVANYERCVQLDLIPPMDCSLAQHQRSCTELALMKELKLNCTSNDDYIACAAYGLVETPDCSAPANTFMCFLISLAKGKLPNRAAETPRENVNCDENVDLCYELGLVDCNTAEFYERCVEKGWTNRVDCSVPFDQDRCILIGLPIPATTTPTPTVEQAALIPDDEDLAVVHQTIPPQLIVSSSSATSRPTPAVVRRRSGPRVAGPAVRPAPTIAPAETETAESPQIHLDAGSLQARREALNCRDNYETCYAAGLLDCQSLADYRDCIQMGIIAPLDCTVAENRMACEILELRSQSGPSTGSPITLSPDIAPTLISIADADPASSSDLALPAFQLLRLVNEPQDSSSS